MQAVTVRPGERDSLRILDIPDVQRETGQVVLRVLQAGLCGTDAEITRGLYGEAPPGCPYLVLGHENLGLVESAPGASLMSPGDLVVSTVRRPCPERCLPCRSGESDMCLTGHYRERGIQGLHGFMAERYAEDPQHLVGVPPHLRPAAILVEPMTVAQKALEQTFRLQGRMSWAPRQAVVLGAGPVGILAAAAMRLRGLEVAVASREPEGSPRDALLREAGIRYVGTSQTPIQELPRRLGAIDLVLEATGAAAVIAPAMSILGRDGVCVLASVTEVGRPWEIDLGAWNRQMVLGNRLIFGTVNAGRDAFEGSIRDIGIFSQRWPQAVRATITGRFPMENYQDLLVGRSSGIKNVITLN